eukprot:363711-Chlamydomonas_euryale.AAC.12
MRGLGLLVLVLLRIDALGLRYARSRVIARLGFSTAVARAQLRRERHLRLTSYGCYLHWTRPTFNPNPILCQTYLQTTLYPKPYLHTKICLTYPNPTLTSTTPEASSAFQGTEPRRQAAAHGLLWRFSYPDASAHAPPIVVPLALVAMRPRTACCSTSHDPIVALLALVAMRPRNACCCMSHDPMRAAMYCPLW